MILRPTDAFESSWLPPYALKTGARQRPSNVVRRQTRRNTFRAFTGHPESARAIEESVVGRIREAHGGLFDPSGWNKMDRARQVEAVQDIVERVGYDAAARRVSIRFRTAAIDEVRP